MLLGFVDDLFDGLLDFALGLLGVAFGFLHHALGLHLFIIESFAGGLAGLACEFVGFTCEFIGCAAHELFFLWFGSVTGGGAERSRAVGNSCDIYIVCDGDLLLLGAVVWV